MRWDVVVINVVLNVSAPQARQKIGVQVGGRGGEAGGIYLMGQDFGEKKSSIAAQDSGRKPR